WLGALAIAAVLVLPAALEDMLRGTPNASQEWADSQLLKDLQASEEGSAKRQAIAQQVCNEARGPNSEARWTPEGHLVCTTRRGVRQVAL
ncbi:hypothetical protein PMI15_00886, partial [Polaromonas sp. CF318]|uniref:hypothetical protein n=1 Tax=Polaromonas sp. CF318 TaxID=1144318 RepID=UPI0002711754